MHGGSAYLKLVLQVSLCETSSYVTYETSALSTDASATVLFFTSLTLLICQRAFVACHPSLFRCWDSTFISSTSRFVTL